VPSDGKWIALRKQRDREPSSTVKVDGLGIRIPNLARTETLRGPAIIIRDDRVRLFYEN